MVNERKRVREDLGVSFKSMTNSAIPILLETDKKINFLYCLRVDLRVRVSGWVIDLKIKVEYIGSEEILTVHLVKYTFKNVSM